MKDCLNTLKQQQMVALSFHCIEDHRYLFKRKQKFQASEKFPFLLHEPIGKNTAGLEKKPTCHLNA